MKNHPERTLKTDLFVSVRRRSFVIAKHHVTQVKNIKVEYNIDREAIKMPKREDTSSLKILRQKLNWERSQTAEELKKLAIKSYLADELRNAVKRKKQSVKFVQDNIVGGEDEYVFVTSDFHYNGDETLLQHFQKVYSHIIQKQKEHGFKRIKLLELGDTIDGGSLRTSQLMAIKKGMVFQIIDVSKAYVDMLQSLSKKMRIEFYCITSSNHTQLRPLGTERNELVEEDLMHVFAEYTRTALKDNKNVQINSGDDFILSVTPKHKMFVAHGHLIGNKKEGYLQELAYHRSVQFEYGLFGHFHHYRELTLYEGNGCNKKVFYAPSMSTVHSSYEHDKNLSSHAGILMMVFNAKRGHRYSEELFIE
jgi:hypothetical protein